MMLSEHVIWWSGLALSPLLVAQALHVRRKIPHLPSAPSPHSGQCVPETPSDDTPVTIVLVGESTVAGVGARSHEHALSGQLAEQLARRLSRPVRWCALGLIGVRARDLLTYQVDLELIPMLGEARVDLIVFAIGANDATKLTPRKSWRASLQSIVARVRGASRSPIVFATVPPLHHFTALPQPLRRVLGARARLLDEDVARMSRELAGCWHHRPDIRWEPEYLASDGFHPSEAGYREWARELADFAEPILGEHP